MKNVLILILVLNLLQSCDLRKPTNIVNATSNIWVFNGLQINNVSIIENRVAVSSMDLNKKLQFDLGNGIISGDKIYICHHQYDGKPVIIVLFDDKYHPIAISRIEYCNENRFVGGPYQDKVLKCFSGIASLNLLKIEQVKDTDVGSDVVVKSLRPSILQDSERGRVLISVNPTEIKSKIIKLNNQFITLSDGIIPGDSGSPCFKPNGTLIGVAASRVEREQQGKIVDVNSEILIMN